MVTGKIEELLASKGFAKCVEDDNFDNIDGLLEQYELNRRTVHKYLHIKLDSERMETSKKTNLSTSFFEMSTAVANASFTLGWVLDDGDPGFTLSHVCYCIATVIYLLQLLPRLIITFLVYNKPAVHPHHKLMLHLEDMPNVPYGTEMQSARTHV